MQEQPPAQAPLSKPLLTAAALTAAAVHQLMLLLPLALLIGLPMLFYRNSFLMAVGVVAFVVLAWIVQPRTHRDFKKIARKDAPALYACVDAICERLRAPRIDAIAWDDQLNAGAVELNRGVSLRPTRRVLLLGLPMLSVLTRPELEAVIAHEMGHFSREHGRLGHWLYRVRQGWMAYVSESDDPDSSPFERGRANLARHFIPWFTRHSHAYSRQCEFEADAHAAQVVGAATAGRALNQVVLAGLALQRFGADGLAALQRQFPSAPADWLAGDHVGLRRAIEPTSEELEVLAAQAEGETHPPLAQRLAALGQPLALHGSVLADASSCAGADLLGAHWAQLLQQHDADWARQHQAQWVAQHALLQWAHGRRQALQAAGTHNQERARCERWLRDFTALQASCETLLLAQPDSVWLNYCLAESLLKAQSYARAMELLQRCIQLSPAWAGPARALLARHAQQVFSDDAQRGRNQASLAKAGRLRAHADAAFGEAIESRSFEGAQLDAVQRQALQAVLAAFPGIEGCWILGMRHRLDDQRSYRALLIVVRQNLRALQQLGLDEDRMVEVVLQALTVVAEPDTLLYADSYLETESLPVPLHRALMQVPDSQLTGAKLPTPP